MVSGSGLASAWARQGRVLAPRLCSMETKTIPTTPAPVKSSRGDGGGGVVCEPTADACHIQGGAQKKTQTQKCLRPQKTLPLRNGGFLRPHLICLVFESRAVQNGTPKTLPYRSGFFCCGLFVTNRVGPWEGCLRPTLYARTPSPPPRSGGGRDRCAGSAVGLAVGRGRWVGQEHG